MLSSTHLMHYRAHKSRILSLKEASAPSCQCVRQMNRQWTEAKSRQTNAQQMLQTLILVKTLMCATLLQWTNTEGMLG